MTVPRDTTDSRTIRGVNVSFEVLRALRDLREAGVTELASHTGYSKSTVHSHLTTLVANEFVVNEGGRYRLSLRILDLAEHARHQFGNYDVVRNQVDAVADETAEVAQFGVEEHGAVCYLYKASGERAVQTASAVGTQQPLHSTGLGKAILAHMPEKRVETFLETHDLEGRTPNTITDEDRLRDELASVRERGYTVDDEENIRGLRCVAAPVTSDGQVIGAVSVSGPSSRFRGQRLEEDLPETVQRAANVIELNTKFS